MDVYHIARRAEERGEITRPLLCELCGKEKTLIKHHRDYSRPLEITWVCYSCHRIDHIENPKLINPDRKDHDQKPIQVDETTHEIIRLESVRQSAKPNTVITMGGVISEYAKRLNKKHKFIKVEK